MVSQSTTDPVAVLVLNNGNRIPALHQSNPNPEKSQVKLVTQGDFWPRCQAQQLLDCFVLQNCIC